MGSDSDLRVMQAALDALDGVRRPVRSAHRVGAPHPGPDVRVRTLGRVAGLAGDHRGRRWRRASARHDRLPHAAPGDRRAGPAAASSTASTRCSRSCRCPSGVPVATVGVGQGAERRVCWPSAYSERTTTRSASAWRRTRRASRPPWSRRTPSLGATRTAEGRAGGYPRNCGARFSTKALMPSADSACPDAATIASASRARCVSSVSSRLVCTRRFAAAERVARPARQLRPRALRRSVHLVVGHDARDQSPVECLSGGQHPVGERELQRAPHAHEAREEPARRSVGRETRLRCRPSRTSSTLPATTRSDAPTKPRPAPAALPCTAATTGASPRTSSVMAVCRSGISDRMRPGSASPASANPLTSPPPQNGAAPLHRQQSTTRGTAFVRAVIVHSGRSEGRVREVGVESTFVGVGGYGSAGWRVAAGSGRDRGRRLDAPSGRRAVRPSGPSSASASGASGSYPGSPDAESPEPPASRLGRRPSGLDGVEHVVAGRPPGGPRSGKEPGDPRQHHEDHQLGDRDRERDALVAQRADQRARRRPAR